jgi:hypothetical protein
MREFCVGKLNVAIASMVCLKDMFRVYEAPTPTLQVRVSTSFTIADPSWVIFVFRNSM